MRWCLIFFLIVGISFGIEIPEIDLDNYNDYDSVKSQYETVKKERASVYDIEDVYESMETPPTYDIETTTPEPTTMALGPKPASIATEKTITEGKLLQIF